MTTTLAEKYRPWTFEQVVGQGTAVKTLSGLIHPEKRGGHVILYGPAGTGKTTLARLYGKALHCESPNESSPCYKCYLCRQAETHGFGYVEVDGSKGHSNDSVREILRNSSENLSFGEWWVVFVDEAQGFGSHFGAMLKTVEEATGHNKHRRATFILATTDLSKIPPTIISRCRTLYIDAIDQPTAVKHLTSVCDQEDYLWEPEALAFIASCSKGDIRKLLINLEQVADQGERKITRAAAIEALNLHYARPLVDYFEALLERDQAAQIDQFQSWSLPPGEKLRYLQAFLLDLYYNEIVSPPVKVPGNPVFTTVTAEQKQRMVSTLRKRAAACGVSFEAFWHELASFWLRQELNGVTDARLEMELIHFDRMVNLAPES